MERNKIDVKTLKTLALRSQGQEMQILLFILPLLVHMPKRCIKRRKPGELTLPAKSMKKKKFCLQLLLLCTSNNIPGKCEQYVIQI